MRVNLHELSVRYYQHPRSHCVCVCKCSPLFGLLCKFGNLTMIQSWNQSEQSIIRLRTSYGF